MRKIIVVFGSALLLWCGCQNHEKTGKNPDDIYVKIDTLPVSTDTPMSWRDSLIGKPAPKLSDPRFLENFQLIDLEDITVSSSKDYSEKKSDYRMFEGRELNAKTASALKPFDIYPNKGVNSGVYACQKFRVNDSLWGLIVRHPGLYSSSMISLLFWNSHNSELMPGSFNLSDDWGDAGERVLYETRIIHKKNGAFQMEQSGHYCSPVPPDSAYMQRCVDSVLNYSFISEDIRITKRRAVGKPVTRTYAR